MPVSKKRKKKQPKIVSQKKGTQNSSMIRYIYTRCGNDEEIPLDVVKTFDEIGRAHV